MQSWIGCDPIQHELNVVGESFAESRRLSFVEIVSLIEIRSGRTEES